MTSTVAVVGSGISGLTAAYVLSRSHQVTLFEADDRFGGHAHTHAVESGRGVDMVDTGFIVHNDRTYPLLRRLFAELDVAVHPTEMSMGIVCEGCGLEYAGGRGAKGIFAQRRRVLDPRFLALLAGVKRFQRAALKLLETDEAAAEDTGRGAGPWAADDTGRGAGPWAADDTGRGAGPWAAESTDLLTYGDFLRRHRFSEHFITHYAIPVVSCVWSSGHQEALQYPARYLFTFLAHHGFLSVKGSPQWFTVQGGSRSYVDQVTAAIGDVRSSTPIRAVSRKPDGVHLLDAAGETHVRDAVVIATHADDALALLTDASDDEQRILGAFEYSRNETVLHRDTTHLPSATGAQSSWNYRTSSCGDTHGKPSVTYWMNRLQGMEDREPYLVSLNSTETIAPESVLATMRYSHPLYTRASVAAQRELGSLSTGPTAFAGAHHGWGFHEDGVRSGLAAAEALGGAW